MHAHARQLAIQPNRIAMPVNIQPTSNPDLKVGVPSTTDSVLIVYFAQPM